MGASRDVSQVWAAFQHRFRWVVGVGGNNDRFPPDWGKLTHSSRSSCQELSG